MRPGIHPRYGQVVTRDGSPHLAFLVRSTATCDLLAGAGRVERIRRRCGSGGAAR